MVLVHIDSEKHTIINLVVSKIDNADVFLFAQIGDYLLTMPQQLEPFTSQDNPALNHALQHGRLPFLEGQGNSW